MSCSTCGGLIKGELLYWSNDLPNPIASPRRPLDALRHYCGSLCAFNYLKGQYDCSRQCQKVWEFEE